MATIKPKKILIAPLDWGLGHTTRCVPIIRHLIALGHHPVFAGNATQRTFINRSLDGIDCIHLDGYNVSYSSWNKYAQAGLLSQLPGLYKVINEEHKWLARIANELRPDGIIADNRYGLFHAGTPSVIITHQLQVLSGMGRIVDGMLRKLHYKYLNRFGQVWVPDAAGAVNLGGMLAHPATLPTQCNYIGLLSRFAGTAAGRAHNNTLLVLLSGSEPQRTALSRLLWGQLGNYNAGHVIFVEGSDDAQQPAVVPPHITYHKRLAHEDLAPLLQNAAMVICRSGYSTLMDLAALNKKAIVIPTPGQTEQMYLGSQLHDKGIFYCARQDGFELNATLKAAQSFPFGNAGLQDHFERYKDIIAGWAAAL